MARPAKQTVDYFPHYSDASTKRTLFILESKFGNDGYAFWFKLLELLCSNDGLSFRTENPANWEFLLAKTRVNGGNRCGNFLKTLADLEAIDPALYEKGVIWSQNLADNVSDAFKKKDSSFTAKTSFRHRKPARR